MTLSSESTIEQAALSWPESIGLSVRHGAEIAPGEPTSEDAERFIGRAV